MKTFKSLMVLYFVCILFSIPGSAWSDNFNDEDISDWDIITGAPTTHATGGLDGTPSLYLEDDSLSYSFDNGYYTDISFYFRQPTGTGTVPFPYTRLTFFDDDVTSYYVNIESQGILGFVTKFSIPSTTYTFDAETALIQPYFKFEIIVDSNTLMADVTVYYINGTVLNTQEIDFSDIYQTTNKFTINSNGGAINVYAYVDNIEITGLEGSPYSETDINWGANSYYEGDQGKYTWSIANNFWSFLYKYRVQISKDGGVLGNVAVGQTGIGYYDMDFTGNYKTEIQYALILTQSYNVLDSDSCFVIPELDSYINVPQTDYTGNAFEISYLYGRTPILPFLKISKRQVDTSYVDTDWINLEDYGIGAGIDYNANLTIYESGTYLIGIYDVDLLSDDNSLLIASDTIRIFYQDAIEQILITESKIDTNNISTIGLGDTLTGNYQVDSINYTNMSVRLEVYNYENDIVSFSVPRQKQKGSYQVPIKNQEYFSEYIDGTNVVYKVDSLFYTGNNMVRIAGYNQDGTFNQTLASVNITIDYVNSAGYSLQLSKYNVVQNEEFIISVKCPTTSTLLVYDTEGYALGESYILKYIDTINITGNKDIKYSLHTESKYKFVLNDPTGNLQGDQLLTVGSDGTTEGVGDGTDEEYTKQGTVEMIVGFLSMPAFWGMIMWVGVVGGASQSKAVNASSTGYIAFSFGNIIAIVGLFAPYTMYILVILWIAAGVFFKIGRKAAGSEEY